MNRTRFFKAIIGYFLQGLVYLTPISLTIYIIYKVFIFCDKLLPKTYPGLGTLAVLAVIILTGLLGSLFIAKPIMQFLDATISRAPLIRMIYTPIKDFVTAMVGDKKKFNEPVLVKINEETSLYKLGFITCRDLSMLGLDDTMVAVYLPHSYAFSGNLFIVPGKNVTAVNARQAEVMKFIVTAGVTKLGVKDDEE